MGSGEGPGGNGGSGGCGSQWREGGRKGWKGVRRRKGEEASMKERR